MKKLLFGVLALMSGVFGGVHAADYGLPTNIQDGNILHCFNWTAKEIKADLANIAAAGFGTIQMSPLQRPDARVGENWHALYRPYDIAFKSSTFCTQADLKALTAAAAEYGIKVIVDVVANHVDKTAGYHDSWWDSNGRVRWNGSINYGDRYSITHGQLGDYGDVNSEDADVIARAKAYVQALKDMGVKGIRWDAAKHIGLPSEGCNFWKEVTSVSGMYHYGEILDAPGPNKSIIKEYAQYMSVTDNQYCNYAAKDNGGIPGGHGGDWAVNYQVPANKLVYWGESHDTYGNDEWSQNVDQSVIDRAYAAYACRDGVTALYLARPNTKGFNNIKVGKGNNAYRNTHIAEVNKFRNVMTGKKDYFTGTGNACSITRQNGGAVIVMKGSGNISIANGGGYCPAGTYTDRVSGGKFTVTSSTISGTVGSSGIAVIYNDGISPNPNPTPDPEPDPEPDPDGKAYCYFVNTQNWNVKVWAWDENNGNANCNANGTWPGDGMTQKDGKLYWEAPAGKVPTHIIFSNNGGTKAGNADLKFVNGATYTHDGTYVVNPTPDPNPNPNPDPDPDASLWILGNLAGPAGWATTPGTGVGMAYKNGEYVAEGVKFVATGANSVCYFNLTDFVGATWDALNTGANRYGAATEGAAITVDVPANIVKYANNVDASACKSWTIEPGLYTVKANLTTMKLIVTSQSGVEVVEADVNAVPEYYNMQGMRVQEPTPGLYIVRRGNVVTKEIVR